MAFDLSTGVQGGMQGASTGFTMGGPPGAIAGGIIGFAYAGLKGGRAKKKDQKLRKQQRLYFLEMMDIAKQYKDIGGSQYNMYKDYFQPIEQTVAKQAQTGFFDAPEEVRRGYMDRASADVMQAFSKQRAISERNMAAYGDDPTSGRALALQQKGAVAAGAAEAGAMTQAARQADEDVLRRRMQAVDLGRQALGTSMDAYGAAQRGYGTGYSTLQGQRAEVAQKLKDDLSILSPSGAKSMQAFMPSSGGTYGGGRPTERRDSGVNPHTGELIRGSTGMLGGGVKDGGPVGKFSNGGMLRRSEYAHGGAVEGPGGPVDDQVPAEVPAGAYVVPADVVEALGVDFFDKMVSSLGGVSGVEGSKTRVNALLSSGEYVIPTGVVQRKGRKFFDDLIAKHHKPAKDQSEQYQSENQGAQPGESVMPFETITAQDGYFGGSLGQGAGMQTHDTPSGQDRYAFNPNVQSYMPNQFAQMNDPTAKPYAGPSVTGGRPNRYGTTTGPVAGAQQGARTGGAGPYTYGKTGVTYGDYDTAGQQANLQAQFSPEAHGWNIREQGTGDPMARYQAARPQDIGVFEAKGGILEDRIARWKAKHAQQQAMRNQAADLAEWERFDPSKARAGGQSLGHSLPSQDLSRADGGELTEGEIRRTHPKKRPPKDEDRDDKIKRPQDSYPEGDSRNQLKKFGIRDYMTGFMGTSGGMSDGGKVGKVMGEFKRGTLHSGSASGPKVTSKDQAVAIALSEARKDGEKVPAKKKKTRRGGKKRRKMADGGKVGKRMSGPAISKGGKKMDDHRHRFADGGHAKYSPEWYKEHGIRPQPGQVGPAPRKFEGQRGTTDEPKKDEPISSATEGYGTWAGKHAGAPKPKED